MISFKTPYKCFKISLVNSTITQSFTMVSFFKGNLDKFITIRPFLVNFLTSGNSFKTSALSLLGNIKITSLGSSSFKNY